MSADGLSAGTQQWLEKRYQFILNPYQDLRHTKCPNCREKTLTRKVVLVVGVAKRTLVYFNMSLRYCRECDILIAHQDRVEAMLRRLPHVPGEDPLSDYQVVGTIDGPVYQCSKAGKLTYGEVARQIRLFRGALQVPAVPMFMMPPDER